MDAELTCVAGVAGTGEVTPNMAGETRKSSLRQRKRRDQALPKRGRGRLDSQFLRNPYAQVPSGTDNRFVCWHGGDPTLAPKKARNRCPEIRRYTQI